MDTTQPHEIARLFRDVSLFADLDDGQLAELGRIAAIEQWSEGDTIFKEGSRNTNLYFVVAGSAALEMHVPRRGAVRLLTVGPGQPLAWSALLGDGTMTATAIAQPDLRMVAFPADELRALCESNHGIGYRVMTQLAKSLSRRLLSTRLQLLDLFTESDSNFNSE